MASRRQRQVNFSELALQCASLGARVRTIEYLTGLSTRDVLQLLFQNRPIARGRAPNSPEWYHTANLLHRSEASIVMSIYSRLRSAGFDPVDGLVGAYRQYCSICQAHRRISFDRAFDLAAHTDGLWLARERAFSVVVCPACGASHLVTYGAVASSDDCPFCRLLRRYATDPRVQSTFPAHPLVDPAQIRLGILALLEPGPAR